ncbi:MAG: hypothetical protein WD508_01505 [Chloroflexota bacterium]
MRQWSDRREAQEKLPELVRRLVFATVGGLRRVQFRSGEGVQIGGWDGVVDAETGNAFVPAAVSGWELGVQRGVPGKADDDYAARTANPGDLNPAETAFVFATSRRFRDKATWAASRRADGVWRDVVALDGDDLAAWLEQAPAVHAWISAELGKLPAGVRSLDEAWRAWADACLPSLSVGLTLGGRDDATAAVAGWLAGTGAVHALTGDGVEEALGFIAAVAKSLPDDSRLSALSRSIVVETPDAWRQLARVTRPLVLIPTFVPPDAAVVAQSGHSVIVPADRATPISSPVDLPRLRRETAVERLREMGIPDGALDDLATLGRRSLLALRRRLRLSPVAERPDWASGAHAQDLIPAMLAGRWREDSPSDRDALGRLANRSYDELASVLARWFDAAEPPLRRDGPAILVVAPEDAWAMLGPLITAPTAEQFSGVAIYVLGATDPARTLPRDERWLAGIRGLLRPHSDLLREGLSEGLVRLAMIPAVAGRSGQERADAVVASLLRTANADASAALWASLGDALPLLAEAAPDRFIEAVERGLAGPDPVLVRLFTDATDAGSLTAPGPDHGGLLWALEGTAWSPAHFARSAACLARFAALDPGGRWANRPKNSLAEIFHPMMPQTNAGPAERLAMLDTIRRQEPVAAWQLLVDLLPERMGVLTFTHRPRVRDWRPDKPEPVTYGEAFATIAEVVVRVIEDAGSDVARWAEIVGSVYDLPPNSRATVVTALEGLQPTSDDDARHALVAKIREISAQHRRFPDAQWRMPEGDIDRLDAVMTRLESSNPVRRHSWLFTQMPDLPEPRGDDWRAYDLMVSERRDQAIEEVWTSGGVAALRVLAEKAEMPWLVGRAAASLQPTEEDQAEIFELLESPDKRLSGLAAGYIAGRHARDGWTWVKGELSERAARWSPARRGAFLTSLPAEPTTWDWADRLGAETKEAYWRGVWPGALADRTAAGRAARELVAVGRSHLAVDLLALHREHLAATDRETVFEALEEAAKTPADPAVGPPIQSWDVARLLDFLEDGGEPQGVRLAGLEWQYLPLLRHSDRPAKLLHAELSRDPDFFVTVLSWLFRSEEEEPRELSESDQLRAHYAFELLNSWQRVPGMREDGTVDAAALCEWVDAARAALAANGRGEIGDQRIGHILRCAPAGEDGRWPAEAVRDLLEDLRSEHVETGLSVEIRNSRGVTSRSPTEGGEQERRLAGDLRADASVLGARWPRIAAVLNDVAESYEAEARRWDDEAQLTEDTWR